MNGTHKEPNQDNQVDASGQRAVAAGGDISGTVVTGDQNVILQLRTLWTFRTGRGTSMPTPATLQRARHDVLDSVRRHWIDTELNDSLLTVARIELGFAERPEAVQNPLRAVLRRPNQPDRQLEMGASIAEVYGSLGNQLLILGEPGAGKTTVLLQLASSLLERAERDSIEPIPVVLSLSFWAASRLPLDKWLIDELRKRYGVPQSIGRVWVESEQVIPLLDGLDEVAEEHRPACADAIDQFRKQHGLLPIVVCSRTHEYEALQHKLGLRGAVVILPLKESDIEAYLSQTGGGIDGIRRALHDDEFRELLTTPLFLSIVVLTYRDQTDLVELASNPADQRHRILSHYVSRRLNRPLADALPRYPQEATLVWLSRLARTMKVHNQSLFYLDWMQPSWLPTRRQRNLAVAASMAMVALVGALIGTTIAAILNGIAFTLIALHIGRLPGFYLALPWNLAQPLVVHVPDDVGPTLLVGGCFGLLVGALLGVSEASGQISPTEEIGLSWRRIRDAVSMFVVLSLVLGLSISLVSLSVGTLLIRFVEGWLGNLAWIGDIGAFALAFWVISAVRRLTAWWSSLLLGASFGYWFIFHGLWQAVTYGFVVGTFLSATFALWVLLNPPERLAPTVPGQGIAALRRNAITGAWVGALFGAPYGFVVGVVWETGLSGIAQGLYTGVLIGAVTAATLGLVLALLLGGGGYLRHHVLRWLLVRDGFAPADYVSFLEYASRLILLRRRGGGYEFVHRLLLEYVTTLDASAAMADPMAPRAPNTPF